MLRHLVSLLFLHVLRVVLQTLNELCHRVALIADLIDCIEQWEPGGRAKKKRRRRKGSEQEKKDKKTERSMIYGVFQSVRMADADALLTCRRGSCAPG